MITLIYHTISLAAGFVADLIFGDPRWLYHPVCFIGKLIAVLEENVITGGYGMQVLECVARKQLSCHVLPIALPDNYVEHGSVEVLRKETGIDAQSVTEKIMETYKELQI